MVEVGVSDDGERWRGYHWSGHSLKMQQQCFLQSFPLGWMAVINLGEGCYVVLGGGVASNLL